MECPRCKKELMKLRDMMLCPDCCYHVVDGKECLEIEDCECRGCPLRSK